MLIAAINWSLDVRSFQDFSSVSVPGALDSNGEINSGTTYDAGEGGDVVIVRAFYAYKVPIADGLSGLSNMSGGRRLIAATTAFRNEPFWIRATQVVRRFSKMSQAAFAQNQFNACVNRIRRWAS